MIASTIRGAAAAAASLLTLGCAGLDVQNPNAPDWRSALANGDDVRDIAVSTVNSWYLTSTHIYPHLALMVAPDANTSNTCMGTRFNNLEPRIAFDNNSSGGDRAVNEVPWDMNYGTLGSANDVIRALDAGVQIANGTENDKYRALAMFAQAGSLTNLALIFDSAFVVDEAFDAASNGPPVLSSHRDVSVAALAKWDALIAFLDGKSESYASPMVLPVTTFAMSSANLRRMASSMAALTLRLTPRTPAEVSAGGAEYWSRILAYANQGITDDLTVQGDLNSWYSYIVYYGASPTWIRVDYRKVNRMDAAGGQASPIPPRYRGPLDIRAPGNPAGNDQRLGDGGPGRDYQFAGGVIGDPGRGLYLQSAYVHARYGHHTRDASTGAATAVPYILKAELDLLKAEALIMSGGSRVEAAALVNNTRVGRGALAPLTGSETNAVLLAAIDYERDIELANTNAFELFYARSAPVGSPLGTSPLGGRIQPGTIRHLPIPARELETLGKTVYTYGGAQRPEMLVAGGDGTLLPLRPPARPVSPIERGFLLSCP